MKVAETQIAQALFTLQEALGERPEGMVVRLGCSFGAYMQWLRGERMPSADWFIKILRLCPDEETRRNFWVDNDVSLNNTPAVEPPKKKESFRVRPQFKFPKPRRKS